MKRPGAVIVADLGFGDAGKGLVTDALCRLGARWVVRYNGGAQAGHNVVTPDGRHHTFAQFGAGTFVPGVRTFLSRHMAVHPTGLLVEASRLAQARVSDALERLLVSADALLITPVHQAAGRLRELARGARRHGSCGVGMGEAAGDALTDPAAPRVRDLCDRRALRRKLAALRERKRAELGPALRTPGPEAAAERRVLEEPALLEDWARAAASLPGRLSVVGDEALGEWLKEETVVFEGAQGVLLDEWHGFHPFTTWSTCTFDNALGLLKEQGYEGPVERLGVLRSYMVRHGPGPFPTEDAALGRLLPEAHNGDGPWQGPVRAGWPDFALLRYALAACGGADGLAVTHLDALPRLPAWKAATAHAGCELIPSSARDLPLQAERTRLLSRAEPVYESLRFDSAEGFVRLVEEALGTPVVMTASGPTAATALLRAGRAPRIQRVPGGP